MKCQYRNCQIELPESKRKDAKFCCLNHRKMEQTYRKRKMKLLNKYKEIGLKQVELIKYLKNIAKS